MRYIDFKAGVLTLRYRFFYLFAVFISFVSSGVHQGAKNFLCLRLGSDDSQASTKSEKIVVVAASTSLQERIPEIMRLHQTA